MVDSAAASAWSAPDAARVAVTATGKAILKMSRFPRHRAAARSPEKPHGTSTCRPWARHGTLAL